MVVLAMMTMEEKDNTERLSYWQLLFLNVEENQKDKDQEEQQHEKQQGKEIKIGQDKENRE